MIKIVKEKL